MASFAVIDTHALIWFAAGKLNKLGRRARAMLKRVGSGRAAVHVSTITLVEIGEAMWLGRLAGSSYDEWVDGLLSTGNFHPVDLTVPIVRRAQTLFSIPERADRLIAATAAELDVPLITRDPAIADAAGVEVIW